MTEVPRKGAKSREGPRHARGLENHSQPFVGLWKPKMRRYSVINQVNARYAQVPPVRLDGKRGSQGYKKLPVGMGGWQFIFRHSQRVGVASGLPAFGLINNFSSQFPRLCKVDNVLPTHRRGLGHEYRGRGLGIEIKYSQFPLHAPGLHCAQPVREDSNLGVPSDANSPSLTQKPQDELTSPSLTITNHSPNPGVCARRGLCPPYVE